MDIKKIYRQVAENTTFIIEALELGLLICRHIDNKRRKPQQVLFEDRIEYYFTLFE